MALALEQIRRMRGGAQAHLMRCLEGERYEYYVVKFQNNPQGVKVLANELLANRLAARIGLPVPGAAVVEVRKELIENSEDLVMQLGRGRAPCRAGLQFGSRYPSSPFETVVYDFLPDEQLREVLNLTDFYGMLAFDKWTCNSNGRQAIFFRRRNEARYEAQMVDQGFCFNAGEWTFPDAPLHGLYARHRVYEDGRGAAGRRAMRVIEQQSEFARVRRLHPETDEAVLRGLLAEFESGLQGFSGGATELLARLNQTLSNAVQLSSRKSVLGSDFETELNRLYQAFVQPKILAYTARRVRQHIRDCEFTAITEAEPSAGNRRHEFVQRLFADEGISLVPLSKIEGFAENLRLRLR